MPILGAVIGDGFAALLAAAQDGSEAAFSQLWRDGNPALLRYLRVLAPEAADDIAAETWVQVVRGLLDERRRRARRPAIPLAEVPDTRLPNVSDAADLALEHLSTRAVLTLLVGLPPLQAEVILLRVVAGLDTETVARMVGRSPGAVRVAAHRGLRRLAQIVTQAGVTL
jgi:RNA polymerase sigma-70 factor (ECF subfamily)